MQPPIQWVPGGSSLRLKNDWGLKVGIHHVVLRLMDQAIPPLPQYVFMSWCLHTETTLPFLSSLNILS